MSTDSGDTAPTTVRDMILRWPSLAEYAAEVGVTYENAKRMRRLGSISVHHWPAVIQAAARRNVKGINAEWLMAQHAGETADQSPEAAE